MSKLITKHNDKINSQLGCNPYKRSFDDLLNKSVIILDKHSGPTSHNVVDSLKKVLNIQRAGHSGTLDPKVTGVLVCGLGKATKLMEYMLLSDKEYICLMYVHKPITKEDILKTFEKFTGKIKQTPPIVSAVKREERERKIYNIELLEIEEQNVLFKVSCEHGTYIRKLCSDMGEYLKTGAHMKELRRIKAGPFRETDNIISLDKLNNLYTLYNKLDDNKLKYEYEIRKYLIPFEEIVKDFKKVYVRNSAIDYIARGSDLAIPGVLKLDNDIEMGDDVRMLTEKDELIGMGTAFLNSNDVIKKKKGAFVKTKKVVFEPGKYPKKWNFNNQ